MGLGHLGVSVDACFSSDREGWRATCEQSGPIFLSVVILSIILLLLGIFLFAGGAYKGALSWSDRDFSDNVEPDFERTDARFRRPAAPSTPRRREVSPGGEVVGGFFFEFEPCRTEASRRYHAGPATTWRLKPDFQSLIALFYPSVTGIMAGCNRSGVLAQPSRSIPIGTLSAILCTTSLYLLVVWVFGSVLSHETLLDNPYVTADVAWPHPVVVKVGIIMSPLGQRSPVADGGT